MNTQLPLDYKIQKLYQVIPFLKFHRITKTYQGKCVICREGKSWLRKNRFFFVVDKELLFCHNCGYSTNNFFKFLNDTTGQTFKEILEESKDYDILPAEVNINKAAAKLVEKVVPTLPQDCINLFDPKQVEFYKENIIVKKVLEYVKVRRIDTAVNRPSSLWLSLSDFTHKNRLVLPFYDDKGNIVFYQSREVFPSDWDGPKYMSKINGDKTVFNLNKIGPDLDQIFIFEGPINACFTKNGVAIAGIQEKSELTLTSKQHQQLVPYFTYERIWCLDSQWIDVASNKKTHILIDQGHKVFIWPSDYGKIFKDFNQMAMRLQKDEIPASFITKNAHSGMSARLLMSEIRI